MFNVEKNIVTPQKQQTRQQYNESALKSKHVINLKASQVNLFNMSDNGGEE